MSGHSKWSNIKHKKAAQDSKRSKVFQKISKEIQIAIKNGGNDPEANSKLKLAIEKGKANNFSSENIKKLLSKSSKDDAQLNEIRYEGYGPGGIAIIVDALTDNINRTSGYVKSIFNKHNGNLGSSNSVSFLFENMGIIVFDKGQVENFEIESIMMIDNIIDIIEENDICIIKIIPGHLIDVRDELEKIAITSFLEFNEGLQPIEAIEGDESLQNKIERMIEKFEESDDVTEVITNLK